MKTIGLLGGLHSAPIAMVSVDFAEIEQLQVAGDRDRAGPRLAECARSVEAAGADFVIAGCTEITLLLAAEQASLPLYDTTAIHARAAVERALADPGSQI